MLGLAFLREAIQSISHNISFSLIIIGLKVVSKKFFDLANLSRAQVFYIYKSTDVIMISKAPNLIFAAFYVVALSFQGFNNS